MATPSPEPPDYHAARTGGAAAPPVSVHHERDGREPTGGVDAHPDPGDGRAAAGTLPPASAVSTGAGPAPAPVRATIIHNPMAGRRRIDLTLAEAALTKVGWSVRDARTGRAGHATELARAAAMRGDDVVVVAGGDGTINEAVQGLAGTETALGVLPVGTANVWAREIGLPRDPVDAAAALAGGVYRRVDLGRAGDRFFLLMAGLGFDGAVTGAVSPRVKRAIGRGAYGLEGLRQLLRYRGPEVALELDEGTVRGPLLLAVAGNTRLYGGDFSLTARAVADDGLLDVVVIPGRRPWEAVPFLLTLLLGWRPTTASPCYYRTRRLRIIGAATVPAQVDGDAIGAPLAIAVAPGALRVVVPRDARSPLFGRPPLWPVSATHANGDGDTHET